MNSIFSKMSLLKLEDSSKLPAKKVTTIVPNFKISNITTTSVKLSWKRPTTLPWSFVRTGYIVLVKIGKVTKKTIKLGKNTVTTIVKLLVPNTNYSFFIQAVNKSKKSSLSKEFKAKTLNVAPGKINILRNEGNTTTSVDISWKAPVNTGSAITGYTVRVESLDATYVIKKFGNVLRGTITGLSPNSSYFVSISATNIKGSGAFSEELSVSTYVYTEDVKTSKPAVPTLGTVTPVSVALNWVAPSNTGTAIVGYRVKVRNLDNGNIQYNVFANVLTGNVINLTQDTSYAISIAATNGAGDSEFSDELSVITPTPPGRAPSALAAPTVGTITETSVELFWNPPADVGDPSFRGYSVQMKDGSYTQMYYVDSSVLTTTINSLTSGITYTFSVGADNEVNVFSYSPTVQATTIATYPNALPEQVTGLIESDVTANAATISWNKPARNGGYEASEYMAKLVSGGVETTRLIANVLSERLTQLTQNTSYSVSVAAKNSVGYGAYSTSVSVNTAAGVPFNTTTFTVSPITYNSLKFDWTAPSNNGGSDLTGYIIDIESNPSIELPTSITTYTKGQLLEDTEYRCRIFAKNALGQSVGTQYITVRTLTDRVPPQMNNPSTGTRTPTSIALAWFPPASQLGSPITQYIIKVIRTSDSSLVNTILVAVDGQNVTTVTGLTSNTEYSFSIAAINKIGQGEYSGGEIMTTLAE